MQDLGNTDQTLDDVSLVDLIAVLLKWRYIILGGIALTLFLLGVYLFLLPMFGIVSFDSYRIQTSVLPLQLPPVLKDELGIEPSDILISYAQEVNAIAEAASRNDLAMGRSNTDVTDLYFRTYISDSFIGHQYKLSNTKSGILFELTTKEAANGKQFLEDLIEYADIRTREDIANRCSVITKTMEDLYKEASTNPALSDSIKQLIISSYIYMKKDIPALSISTQTEVFIETKNKKGKIAVLSILISLLMFCFLSFILEYIDQIKKDPDSVEKIRNALNTKRHKIS